MPGLPDDLADWGPGLRQALNGFVGFLPAQISFILEFLGTWQKLGINNIASDSLPDLAHGFADRIEECSA